MKYNVADTIVIGGGIAGSSTAYRLAEKGQKVILLERGRIAGEASGRNGGGVRRQGRDPAELPLAMEAFEIWGNMQNELDCDVGYRRHGSQMVARTQEQLASLLEDIEREQAIGLDVEMLSPEDTRRLNPTIPEHLEVFGSKYCPTDGTANSLLVTKAICRMARRKGVQIREFEPVRQLKAESGRITAVVTDRGEYHGAAFVNAAGPWARGLCNTIGPDFPSLIEKSRILVTEQLPVILKPFVLIDEVYCRQTIEGNVHIGPFSAYTMDSFDRSSLLRDFLEAGRFIPKLLPVLRNTNIIRAFAGVIHYTPDLVAILDKAPDFENFFLIAGCSGHGFGLGPIYGKLIAEWIADENTSLDLTPLRWNRFDHMKGNLKKYYQPRPLGL